MKSEKDLEIELSANAQETDRRRFLKTLGHAAAFTSLGSSYARAQSVRPPANVQLTTGSIADVLQPQDFSYLGCMRMPNIDTEFGFGTLTARRVGNQLRFFLYGRNPGGFNVSVASISSAQTLNVTAGQGSYFKPGLKVSVARAANGNNLPESRTVQSISGDAVTFTTPLDGNAAPGDVVSVTMDYYVFEVADTGTYSTDYLSAPRMSLVTAWPDIYNGRRVTWRNGRILAPMSYLFPAGLYWHEANQLLYWGYFDAYNGSTGYPDWCLGATRLDNPATGATTSFGPWRPRAVDGDGTTWYGPARGAFMMLAPDGSMGTWGAPYGALQMPWGPQLYAGAPWPTASTPSGQAAPDIVLRDRYLEHYYMGSGPNSFNADGSARGTIRSFRYPSSPARPYIYEGIDSPVPYADPARNAGICTWTSLNGLGGALWLQLRRKRGVVFAAKIVGSPDTDPTHLRAAHVWYQNAGVGNGVCKHGFGVGRDPNDVPNIAGPVSTAAFPSLIIYNPDDLLAVKNRTLVDYKVNPTSWIDLQSSFGIRTPVPASLAAASCAGFYFDSVRNYLFVLSHDADNSIPGVNYALIHVFRVNDGA